MGETPLKMNAHYCRVRACQQDVSNTRRTAANATRLRNTCGAVLSKKARKLRRRYGLVLRWKVGWWFTLPHFSFCVCGKLSFDCHAISFRRRNRIAPYLWRGKNPNKNARPNTIKIGPRIKRMMATPMRSAFGLGSQSRLKFRFTSKRRAKSGLVKWQKPIAIMQIPPNA
jgi:hypothetical protein